MIITGRVQGVYFRESTREIAERLGVVGWIKNLPDGKVEALFQGSPDAVESCVEFCRQGPAMANVEGVVVERRQSIDKNLTAFHVLRRMD